jgi:hypothetical protein
MSTRAGGLGVNLQTADTAILCVLLHYTVFTLYNHANQ